MTHDEAVEAARRERDAYIGKLLDLAMREAANLHHLLGLPPDMKVVVDDSGVFTEGPDGVRRAIDAANEGVKPDTFKPNRAQNDPESGE